MIVVSARRHATNANVVADAARSAHVENVTVDDRGSSPGLCLRWPTMSIAAPEPHLRPDQMVARAVALRQHLRDDQAKTEARSRYSEETHGARSRTPASIACCNRECSAVTSSNRRPSIARSSRSPAAARRPAGCCASVPATHCRSGRRSRNRPRPRSSGRTGTSWHRSASATSPAREHCDPSTVGTD